METFFEEVKRKAELIPQLGFDERDDRALISELVDKVEKGETTENINNLKMYIRGILGYYGISLIN